MGAFLLFLDWSALRTRRHRARRASYLLGKVKRVRYEADIVPGWEQKLVYELYVGNNSTGPWAPGNQETRVIFPMRVSRTRT